MPLSWIVDRMRRAGTAHAMVWRDATTTYDRLVESIDFAGHALTAAGVKPGMVVALEADYSPQAVALLFALGNMRCIVAPRARAASLPKTSFLETAEIQATVIVNADETFAVELRDGVVKHPLTRRLIDAGTPGLILFSSGSTGASKAILHDLARLVDRHRTERQTLRTIAFLLLDHIGGINTLCHVLANTGTVVALEDRAPDVVCRAIEAHKVELLPTSPTFLNMLLSSDAHNRFDLSSLKRITYGTEAMPEATLKSLSKALPKLQLQQTYGLSELGILQSKSKESGSLWVKIGGAGFETKVVNERLWIRSQFSMLGYLNAPSPFDAEGWFDTGDRVAVEGEYVRIFGRDSDMINVGGEKVYPSEVESVLLEMPNVRDATVYGAPNAVTGKVVAARLVLHEPEPLDVLRARVREFCGTRLARYKIPLRIEIADSEQVSERYKKRRLQPELEGK